MTKPHHEAFLCFVADGQPIAQPRYEQSWRGGKRVARIRPTASGEQYPVIAWKQYLAGVAHNAIVDYDRVSRSLDAEAWTKHFHMPMRLFLTFVMPTPSRWKYDERQWHIIKPDLDNLVKSLKDAMTGVVWHDDAQVTETHLRKVYAGASEVPHVVARIEVLFGQPGSDDL